jgi:hypothetical protein
MCGTKSILFWKYKILLIANETVFLMLLQYCNSLRVIYVNRHNKTIKNSKNIYNFKCSFFSNAMVWKKKLNTSLQIASQLSHLPVDINLMILKLR